MSLLRPLLAALARMSPISRYIVDGPSMEPAYRAGDRLIVNRLAYVRRGPSYGDVVVLRDPDDDTRLLIKRIAPSPDGDVSGRARIWVLGDNADESRDSRSFGSIDRRRIVGKAWLRY
jgi:nickel-type superoxide dismutase maturation protease